MKTKNNSKDFDCVKMMRGIREKISAEIADMTPEQIIEYIRIGNLEYEKKNHAVCVPKEYPKHKYAV